MPSMSTTSRGNEPSSISRAKSSHSARPLVCVASWMTVTPARKKRWAASSTEAASTSCGVRGTARSSVRSMPRSKPLGSPLPISRSMNPPGGSSVAIEIPAARSAWLLSTLA